MRPIAHHRDETRPTDAVVGDDINVKVRLKMHTESMVGRITCTEHQRFLLKDENSSIIPVQYTLVASITPC